MVFISEGILDDVKEIKNVLSIKEICYCILIHHKEKNINLNRLCYLKREK